MNLKRWINYDLNACLFFSDPYVTVTLCATKRTGRNYRKYDSVNTKRKKRVSFCNVILNTIGNHESITIKYMRSTFCSLAKIQSMLSI